MQSFITWTPEEREDNRRDFEMIRIAAETILMDSHDPDAVRDRARAIYKCHKRLEERLGSMLGQAWRKED